MPTILTIGHSNKTSHELIEKLKENKVSILVDVRSKPYSKYNPQFNRELFSQVCRNKGVKYLYRGRNLGGLLENTYYDEAIAELKKMAIEGEVPCVMCSEAEPEKCHRQSKLQPSFEAEGCEVKHILWKKSSAGIGIPARIENKQKSLF